MPVAVLTAWFAAALPAAVHAQATPQGDFWIANGPVYATALSGATLYVGGDFTYVGPDTGAGTVVDTVTAQASPFPAINGQVYAAVPDGGGGWYVGGSFTLVGGATLSNLAHVIPDPADNTKFTVDTQFAPNADGGVNALALSADGKTLYVGGAFANIGGAALSHIAALNTTAASPGNEAIAGWAPNADGPVNALLLSGDGTTLYVGGAFANIGGAVRNDIAALDAGVTGAGGAVAPWDPNADGAVNAMGLSTDGTTLYVGGAFANIGGAARSHLAALAADVTTAGAATAWAADADGTVNAVVTSADGKSIYVGGAFNSASGATASIGGKVRDYLAKVDAATGAVDDTWAPTPDAPVHTLELLSSTLAVGGEFTSVTGARRDHLASVSLTSGIVASWNPGAENTVRVIKLDTSSASTAALFVGGDFISIGGADRNRLAALNTTTNEATKWNPGVDGIVRAIAPSATAIYIGGDFSAVGGRARNHLAAVDPSSAQALAAWDMNVDGTVYALLLHNATLYVGGAFAAVGGSSHKGLAAIDTSTPAVTAWSPQVDNGAVLSMALSSDATPVLYVGGSFTSINGVTRNRLASLTSDTAALTSWDPEVDNGTAGKSVMAVALSTAAVPVLYVGGDFTTIGATARHDLAGVNTSDGSAVSWDPASDTADGPVRTLALAGDNVLLYAGGDFTQMAGSATPRVGFAALTATDGLATAWDPAPSADAPNDTTVRSLVLGPDHGTLYVGGDFTRISAAARPRLAVFAPPVSAAAPAAGAYDSSQSVQLTCTDAAGQPCADIYFSTDGSVPGNPPYATGTGIPVDVTETLKFYGTAADGMREVINSADYIIDTVPPTVSADPKGGTYTALQNVVLTCKDSGGSGCSIIYYTLDGSVPTTASKQYTSAIPLANDTDLMFFTTDVAGNRSAVEEEKYVIDSTPPTTTASPPAGTYTVPQTVTLTCDDGSGFGCAATYFTTDGSVPNTSSPRYTQPIVIDANTTLNYFSVDNAGHQESPVTGVYLIQTGTVVTRGGGLFCPPRYLLGGWLLWLARAWYLRRRRGRMA